MGTLKTSTYLMFIRNNISTIASPESIKVKLVEHNQLDNL